MKKLWITVIILLPFLLTACNTDEENDSNPSDLGNYTVSNSQAEVREGDFVYRLVAEQEEFEAGGPVSMYAELEYTGEQENIEIFHAASPFFFPLYEKTRDYNIDSFMAEPLISTTLTKGQPLREEYSGRGGYFGEDDQKYKDFIDSIVKGEFPAGYYEAEGYASFYTEDANSLQEDYKIPAHIDFKVVE